MCEDVVGMEGRRRDAEVSVGLNIRSRSLGLERV